MKVPRFVPQSTKTVNEYLIPFRSQCRIKGIMPRGPIMRQRGFTLLEMIIAIIITGIITLPVVQGYHLYLKDRANRVTNENIKRVSEAIQGYYLKYHRYPCPSVPDIRPGDLTGTDAWISYRVELREAATGGDRPNPSASSTCAKNGNSSPTLTTNNWGFTNTYGYRHQYYTASGVVTTEIKRITTQKSGALIGGIPFEDIGLEESSTYDGYNSRFIYAVSQQLTVADNFAPDRTSIIIGIPTGPTGQIWSGQDAQYVLVSAGEDHMGAFYREVPPTSTWSQREWCRNNADADPTQRFALFHTLVPLGTNGPLYYFVPRNGVTSGATATGATAGYWPRGYMARANCDGDAVFINPLSKSTNKKDASYYDDTLFFKTSSTSALWSYNIGTNDIYNMNNGNVGIGTETPQATLDVGTMGTASGISVGTRLHAYKICDIAGANCFMQTQLGGSSYTAADYSSAAYATDNPACGKNAGTGVFSVPLKTGVGGALSTNSCPNGVPVGTIRCPLGYALKGISSGGTVALKNGVDMSLCVQVQASSVTATSCGTGKYAIGISSAGTLICEP